MKRATKLLKEFTELDFRIRCCENYTGKEAKRMVTVVNRLNVLKALPNDILTDVMAKNNRRAEETSSLLDGWKHVEENRRKAASEVRPLQNKKQRVRAHLAKCKSGYV